MDEKEFVDELPSYTTCARCQLTIDAPIWRVSRFGSDWLALNVVSCPKCGNVIIGAAGSSLAAMQEAKTIRARLLSTSQKDNFG